MKFNPTNIIVALLITIFPFLILFAPIIINYNKSGSNTYVLDQDYSHLSRDQIINRLNQSFSLPQSINLTFEDKKNEFNLASISAKLDSNRIASSILYRRLDEGIFAYIKYFFQRKNFILSISYDQDQLNQQINNLASSINKPFIPTEFQLKNGQINVTSGSIGLSLNQSALKDSIISQLSYGKFSENINLPIENVGSLPSESQINDTVSKAKKFIGKSLTLKTDKDSINIDDKTIISWINYDNTFQKDKISEYSKNLANSLKRDPVNALFRFENGRVLEFQPSSDGITPDPEALSQLIITNLSQLDSLKESNISFNIPVKTTPAIIQTDDVNNLGIKELLGKGTSSFKHSAATRNENITKGSSIINRILVAPNETFSFIKNLGEVSLEAGFKKAYIIREGKTELDVGGGICQVSTTLFRAMLDAGLNIIERQNHAYRVSYYEEDSKPGFDATVFIPNPDLKFINDTDHYVLIQSILDMTNRRLTYEIYGTSDGRKSEISNYRQWGSQPAPPDVWIDDPTLPAGKIIQDEHAIPGLKTAFDWTVKDKDGKIIHQKTFQSVFVPWAAVYRRGTGQ